MSDATSDPLPYAQVDRAVKPKAATLATMVGVTYQHALGSLAEFWEACGDPRELERLLQAGKEEVVLPRDEVAGRLLVAFGKPVDPDACRHLGLLEQRPDGFRVRGMSRYFAPIKARMMKRAAGSRGGKASADSRKATEGTAQPRSAGASESAQAAPKQNDVLPKQCFGEIPKQPEPADSVQRSTDTLKTAAAAELPKRPPLLIRDVPADKFANAEGFWAWAQSKRVEVGLVSERFPAQPRALSAWWSEVGMALNGDYGPLEEAWYRFGADKFWQDKAPPAPFAGFMSQWPKFIPQRGAA